MAAANDLRPERVTPAFSDPLMGRYSHGTFIRSLIHLFSWSGLIDANILLSDLFKVPNLQTGRMEPIISALSPEEEEMARNMLRRLNTIFSVGEVNLQSVLNCAHYKF